MGKTVGSAARMKPFIPRLLVQPIQAQFMPEVHSTAAQMARGDDKMSGTFE